MQRVLVLTIFTEEISDLHLICMTDLGEPLLLHIIRVFIWPADDIDPVYIQWISEVFKMAVMSFLASFQNKQKYYYIRNTTL